MAKEVIDLSFDFGFEFTDDPQEQITQVASQADEATQKAKMIYDAVMPLLKNLKMNPEKPNIYWPNRVEKIDEFIKKLDSIIS